MSQRHAELEQRFRELKSQKPEVVALELNHLLFDVITYKYDITQQFNIVRRKVEYQAAKRYAYYKETYRRTEMRMDEIKTFYLNIEPNVMVIDNDEEPEKYDKLVSNLDWYTTEIEWTQNLYDVIKNYSWSIKTLTDIKRFDAGL